MQMVSEAEETLCHCTVKQAKEHPTVNRMRCPYRSIIVAVLAMKHLIALNPTVTSWNPDMGFWIRWSCLNHITFQCNDTLDDSFLWDVGMAAMNKEESSQIGQSRTALGTLKLEPLMVTGHKSVTVVSQRPQSYIQIDQSPSG
jgi:uncharacterized protein YcbX